MKGKRPVLGIWQRALLVVPPLLVLAFVLVAGFGALFTSAARAAVVVNESVPLERTAFVPCANGGSGEVVDLTGSLHALITVTLDSQGGFHEHILFNPQDVSGVGLTTGLKYQGVGMAEEDINGAAGTTDTFVDVYDLIGQGPGNNFTLHVTTHVTINAGGSLTSSVVNVFSTCG